MLITNTDALVLTRPLDPLGHLGSSYANFYRIQHWLTRSIAFPIIGVICKRMNYVITVFL